jgi:hypothetical protein
VGGGRTKGEGEGESECDQSTSCTCMKIEQWNLLNCLKGGEGDNRVTEGSIWSKYTICTYGNITMKPLCTINNKLIKMLFLACSFGQQSYSGNWENAVSCSCLVFCLGGIVLLKEMAMQNSLMTEARKEPGLSPSAIGPIGQARCFPLCEMLLRTEHD